MAKKRGKPKVTSRKPVKKAKAVKKVVVKTSETPMPTKNALHELEILAEEKKTEEKVSGVEKKEQEIEGSEMMRVRGEERDGCEYSLKARGNHSEVIYRRVANNILAEPEGVLKSVHRGDEPAEDDDQRIPDELRDCSHDHLGAV